MKVTSTLHPTGIAIEVHPIIGARKRRHQCDPGCLRLLSELQKVRLRDAGNQFLFKTRTFMGRGIVDGRSCFLGQGGSNRATNGKKRGKKTERDEFHEE